MRIDYELTEADVLALQLETLTLRQRWLVRHPVGIIGLTLVASALAWPLAQWFFSQVMPGPPVGAAPFGVAMVLAGLLVFALGRTRWLPRTTGVMRWSARRLVKQSLKRSVLGPVTVEVTEAGLTRTNNSGALEVPWSNVGRLVQYGDLLLVHLKKGRLALLAPRRAFADDVEAAAFRTRLEKLSGHVTFTVPS